MNIKPFGNLPILIHLSRKTVLIISLLTSTWSYSQNEVEFEVFESILKHENQTSDDVIYFRCTKPKTYFDYQDFRKKIPFDIEIEILQELEKNALISEDDLWKSKWVTAVWKNSKPFKNRHCLTKKDVTKLFDKTRKRNSVLSISDPVFSVNNEYCIVSISYLMFPGSAYGYSYFLEKINGVWEIKASYNEWLS